MTTKTFCDACGKEGASNPFSYLCHIDGMLKDHPGYIDNDGESVSGRSINADLCNQCYNIVTGPAVKKLHDIRKKHGKPWKLDGEHQTGTIAVCDNPIPIFANDLDS